MGGSPSGEGKEASQRARSLSGMLLGSFEGEIESGGGCADAGDTEYTSGDDGDEEEGGGSSGAAEERRAFWESQHRKLEAALSRWSSLEVRVRRETEAAMRELRGRPGLCSCSRSVRECRDCLLRVAAERLRSAGLNSALCKARWRSSADIPRGEHTYIDVVGDEAKKGGSSASRVVVDPSFRSEFEVARASYDYTALLRRLPEVYVGKAERLGCVLKVVCAAAKRCMKENRMHVPPWRRHEYMRAKWLAPCERVAEQAAAAAAAPPPVDTAAPAAPRRQPKPRASMLTMDAAAPRKNC